MGKSQRSNVIAIRAPPHRELACGFNGVRATKPRLYGTVEVRSPAGIPIAAIYVSLALYCHENISYRPEGRSSLTSQKQSTTTIVGKELLLWQAPDGRSHEDIMSMDLPFMIPFPIATDEVLAATLNHSSRSTTYEVAATLHSTQFASERVALEVIMERFDQLPIWGMFAEAQLLKPVSIDHIVEMELQLPRTCYGPSDAIVCTITLSGNPDWPARVKKVRAEKLTMALEKVVTYHPPSTSSLPTHTTIKKITDQRIDFGGLKLLDAPITQRITMSFPKPDTLVRDKSGLVHHANQMSPPSPNFTTKCRLYSIAFQITVKATFKGAKEIVSTTPIIASQYNLSESRVILENIESAVYEGADIDVVAGISGNPVIIKHSPSSGHQGGSAVTGMGDRRRTVIME